jgi:hypothetical protein
MVAVLARRRPTHGALSRSRFIARELVPWMEGRRPDDLLFPAPRGGALRVRNFRRDVFDPAVRRVDPPGFHPHELRHTGASLAIASGADVKVVRHPGLERHICDGDQRRHRHTTGPAYGGQALRPGPGHRPQTSHGLGGQAAAGCRWAQAVVSL